MREAISKTSLPLDCKPHSLRKAAGRLLAEAGAAARMVMSVLGHATLIKRGLPKNAVVKLEQRRDNSIPQTTFERLGKPSKNERKSTWNDQGWRAGRNKTANTYVIEIII